MDTIEETAVEYRGHYIVRDMIQCRSHDRGEADSAQYTRFGIMKAVDGKRKTINWALSEDAARAKIDDLVVATRKKR